MTECKPAKTPLETNFKIEKSTEFDEEVMARYPYQRLIGALMYLAVTTRPDIAFAVNYMSQFNTNYNGQHWKAAKRILRYLNGTRNYGLLYTQNNKALYGVVDADWGANLIDRRSYSGYAFILAGAAVSWEARKQRTVALSSTEAEYMAMTEATKEAMYLQGILKDLGICCPNFTIFNDSQSAQKLIQCLGYSSRTKHINVRHHFVKECYQSGKIALTYMPTEDMPADVFTKSLSSVKHCKCSAALGMASSLTTSRGGVGAAK
ncbi:secreted RxLR effector protein 161-like [Rhagoletis pomonella]|uniref:secreted RxLR effector protein 161-like n=1 Tax=Rhagoletis pomonella TaxID=28610 RepID=UPI001784B65C|nr:secreted RxLR effector protein 161-like [Rhagoletis pomonella]